MEARRRVWWAGTLAAVLAVVALALPSGPPSGDARGDDAAALTTSATDRPARLRSDLADVAGDPRPADTSHRFDVDSAKPSGPPAPAVTTTTSTTTTTAVPAPPTGAQEPAAHEPAPAEDHAPPPVVDPDLPYHQAVAPAVLGMISYPWEQRLPGWTVSFLPGRSGYLGGTWTDQRRIELYVRDGQDVAELAFTLAHEMGHAVDLTYFGSSDRRRWLEARGAPGAQWWAGSGVSDYASGSGDWAEAFAVWVVGGHSLTKLGGQPTAADLSLVAELAWR